MASRFLTISIFIGIFAASFFVAPTNSFARGLISTAMEVEIGKEIRDEFLQKYKQSKDEKDKELVEEITTSLLQHTTRDGISYEFYILEWDEVNAFAAPGGFIFITTGLLDFCERDPSMIAGVLGHEITHVEHKHSRKGMEKALYREFGLRVLFSMFDIDEKWAETAAGVALTLIEQGYSREDEYDADRGGILLMYKSGWDPEPGLIKFLQKLDEESPGMGGVLGTVGSWFSSHPDSDRRVMFGQQYLDEIKESVEFNPQPLPEKPKKEIKKVERSREKKK